MAVVVGAMVALLPLIVLLPFTGPVALALSVPLRPPAVPALAG